YDARPHETACFRTRRCSGFGDLRVYERFSARGVVRPDISAQEGCCLSTVEHRRRLCSAHQSGLPPVSRRGIWLRQRGRISTVVGTPTGLPGRTETPRVVEHSSRDLEGTQRPDSVAPSLNRAPSPTLLRPP